MAVFFTQRTFANEALIHAPLAVVRQILTDPVVLTKLSPLVVQVTFDANAPKYFYVVDQLMMFGSEFQTRYKAKHEVVEGGVDAQAWSFPRIHVFNRWRLQETGEGTLAREDSTLTMPRPVAGYVYRTAYSGHSEMMQRLKALAEKNAGVTG